MFSIAHTLTWTDLIQSSNFDKLFSAEPFQDKLHLDLVLNYLSWPELHALSQVNQYYRMNIWWNQAFWKQKYAFRFGWTVPRSPEYSEEDWLRAYYYRSHYINTFDRDYICDNIWLNHRAIISVDGRRDNFMFVDDRHRVFYWVFQKNQLIQECEFFIDANIIKVKAFYDNYHQTGWLLLDDQGCLWMIQQYGHGFKDPYKLFGLYRISDSEPCIVEVDVGDTYMIALDKQGQVWVFGDNSFVATSDSRMDNRPTIIQGIPPIKHIAAGSDHALLIDQDDQLWGWGLNSRGQLGAIEPDEIVNSRYHGGDCPKINSPKKLPLSFKVKQVFSGMRWTLVVDFDGNVWGTGDNSNGCLGFDINEPHEISDFTLNPTIEPNHHQITCGLQFTAIRYEDRLITLGEIYGYGFGRAMSRDRVKNILVGRDIWLKQSVVDDE